MDANQRQQHIGRAVESLKAWVVAADRYWQRHPQQSDAGWYGTGYNNWGVQTNQKYVAAMAVLGTQAQDSASLEKALAAMRFSLRTHRSAQDASDGLACTDGTRWGHTWISPLGIERMMFAVNLLKPHMTDDDLHALQRMLVSEAIWQHDHHARHGHVGIHADPWNSSGKNNPESNLWVGALLWRTAVMYPQHPQAHAWRDKAESYLFNSVSIEADSHHPRYVGPNFFPNFALDHHGYFNVGYMVICTSNASLLHFDLKAQQLLRPQYLDHHQAELWSVIRAMLFDDARLARLGGDSRLRYTYCQEYLLPALLYAADRLGDPDALALVPRQLSLIEAEQQHSGDGSYHSRRLRHLFNTNPYYATRLESDRACVLAHLVTYLPLVDSQPAQPSCPPAAGASAQDDKPCFVRIDAWDEPTYGAMLHRCDTRLASFAWRAHGYAQGLCLPPGRSDMAEWSSNLAGTVRFVGQPATTQGGQTPHRKLIAHNQTAFPGGFVTLGSIVEGVDLLIPEGQRISDLATHHLCFAALPDGHSVVGIQLITMRDKFAWACQLQGMRLNMPNDLYNQFRRTWHFQQAGQAVSRVFQSPPARDELVDLASTWACADDTLGVVGLYGASSLTLDRSVQGRGGYYSSLHVDELCWQASNTTTMHQPGEVVLDVAWRVMASVDHKATAALATADASLNTPATTHPSPMVRSVTVRGCDGRTYSVTADFQQLQASVRNHDAPGE